MDQECRFEPDAMPILCINCEKPTGEMGTCDDIGLCASCHQQYLDMDWTEQEIATLKIGLATGEYGYKPHRERVFHLGQGSSTLCHARGGPHLIATSPGEVNCKRCLR